jgi:hypothetical protein
MTIQDLLDELEGLSPDMPIVTPNFFGGYSDVTSVEVMTVTEGEESGIETLVIS